MAIPVAVVAAWVSVLERLAAIWAKWRKKPPAPPGDPTGTAPVTPAAPGGDKETTVVIGGKTYRRRPPVAPVALVLLVGWALAGCTMSNDEVIKEVAKCQAAGMYADAVRDGWTFAVKRVVCLPPQEKNP